jgi:predicted methyltransferase
LNDNCQHRQYLSPINNKGNSPMTSASRYGNGGWIVLSTLLISACASIQKPDSSGSAKAWTNKTLSAALSTPSRAQADRDLDADRKPAELMTFFGIERGMTVVEYIAGRGFMTEVLSITVGATGKVYAQYEGADKTFEERLANNRLPNVQHVSARTIPIAPGSADLVITVMNLHDVYNSDIPLTQNLLKYVHSLLKPDGTLAVVDHVGIPGADNAKLHRMQKQQAIDVVTAAGFVLEAESNVLARSTDDHTKRVTDPSIRSKTDQFVLKFRKAK